MFAYIMQEAFILTGFIIHSNRYLSIRDMRTVVCRIIPKLPGNCFNPYRNSDQYTTFSDMICFAIPPIFIIIAFSYYKTYT